MQTISLLGCGKLGFPLALDLLNEGYNIKGSTTTISKIDKLKQSGITPYLINIDEFIELDFFNSDILILTLPFKKSFSDFNNYKIQIKKVCDSLRFSNIKHIIFTSSSSIYPKDNKIYLPTEKFIPTNVRAEVQLDCEKELYKMKNISVIIIRLGGIYGAGRKIKKSLKYRRLIKQSDAISLIKDSINRVGENDIINGFQRMVL